MNVFKILQQNSKSFIIQQPNNFGLQQIVFIKPYFEKWLRFKSINSRISSEIFNFYTPISRDLPSGNYGISQWKNLKKKITKPFR